ncbi:MAG: hypothetical protein KGP10_03975 [Actinomycetales bacterium]|nr:hypothetical protein [Actinomycetales bacterium]
MTEPGLTEAGVTGARRPVTAEVDSRSGPGRVLIAAALIAYLPTLVVIWVATTRGMLNLLWGPPRGDLGTRFFSAQLQSVLIGRSDVDRHVLEGECFNIRDLCVGYHGLGPSILRLPAELSRLGGLLSGDPLNGLSTLYTFLAINAGVVAALAILIGALTRSNLALLRGEVPVRALRPIIAGLLIALGPGSLLLILSTPNVYHEAIAWSAAMVLIAFGCFLGWSSSLRPGWLVGALFAGVIAAHSRLGAGITLAVIALLLLAAARGSRLLLRDRVLLLGCALLPLLSALSANMWKFGALLPNWAQHATEGSVFAEGGPPQTSWTYLPTKLWAMVRADGAVLTGWTGPVPVVRLRDTIAPVVPQPIVPIDYEATGSLTSFASLPLLLTAIGVVGVIAALARLIAHRRLGSWLAGPDPDGTWREPLNVMAMSTVAAAAGLAPTLAFFSMTNRYLADAWPLLVVGSLTGLLWLLRRAVWFSGWRRALPWLAIPLAAYSAVLVWSYALGQAMPLSLPLPQTVPSLAYQEVVCPRVSGWTPERADGISMACIDVGEDREGLTAPALAALAVSDRAEVRAFVAARPADPATLALLVGDDDITVRIVLAANPAIGAPIQERLVGDDLRVATALAANPAVLSRVQDALARGDVLVQVALAGNPVVAQPVLTRLAANTENVDVDRALAANPATAGEVLGALAKSEDPETRLAVVQNPRTQPETLTRLVDDVNPDIGGIAARRLAGG